jgi:hypothetical protein
MRRHSSQRAKLAAVAAVTFLSFSTSGHAQTSSITTKLMGRIDSRRIAEGAPFFVKTISTWKEGRCSIPMGVTLEGRVAKIVKRGPGVKREEIDLRFLRLPCPSDDTQEVTPILVAMHGPKKSSNDNMLAQEWLTSLFAATAGSHAAGAGSSSGGLPAPPGALGRNTGTLGKGGYNPTSSKEETIKAGEVQDFPTVKLSLPTLTSDPTVLTSTGELFFDPDARFIIVVRLAPSNGSKLEMARAASPSASSHADGSINRQSVPPAPAPVPALIENCVNGGCVTAPDATPVAAESAQTEVPLTDLAYRPRTRRTIRGGLEDDAAIAFLGDDQIFATFNSHPLVPRSEAQAIRSSSPRQIRGVLVSAADGRRLRVVDWLVPDQGAYLWPLDRGRVLVHVGNALVVYGRNLEEEARWEIQGSLLFVTISPSRTVILTAVKREKYDAATFRRLADFVGSAEAVQEDYDLIALNGRLEPTSSRPSTQIPVQPPLLDSGVVSLTQGPRRLWKVEETYWDQRGKRLAELASGCVPVLQTLPANLLFVSGCQADSRSKWYRVLRADGKTLLRGATSNGAIPEFASASSSGSVFAIGVEQAVVDVDWNTGMHIADLETMTVAVYRASDGKRVYATKVHSHAVDRRVFALSDSGERLAVLADDSVRIYRTGQTP